MFLWAHCSRSAEDLLYPLEFIERHHWLVLANVRHSVPDDHACVERISQNCVEVAARYELAADSPAPRCCETPLVAHDLIGLVYRIAAGEKKLPSGANMSEPLGIFDNRLSLAIVLIAKRRVVWNPPLFQFG